MNELAQAVETGQLNGTETIGSLVCWTVKDGISIDRKPLVDALEAAGLKPEIAPKVRSVSIAWHRAAQAWKTSGVEGIEARRVETRDSDLIQHAFVRITADRSARELDLTNEHWMAVSKSTGVIVAKEDRKAGDPIWDRFVSIFNEHKNHHDSQDVRNLLNRSVQHLYGFSLRAASGGVYFIPRDHMISFRKMVDHLQESVGKVDLQVFDVPQFKTSEGTASLAEGFRAATQTKFQEFELALAEFQDADGPRRQDRSFTSRVTQLHTLRTQATLYESLLGEKLQDVRDGITALESAAEKTRTEVIGRQDSAKSAKETAAKEAAAEKRVAKEEKKVADANAKEVADAKESIAKRRDSKPEAAAEEVFEEPDAEPYDQVIDEEPAEDFVFNADDTDDDDWDALFED